MRTANERVWNHALHNITSLRLVLAVEKGEQKADYNGLEAALLEKLRCSFNLIERERNLDLSGRRAQSLVHHQTIAALDQRLRLPGHIELQREIMRSLVPRHMQDVTKSARGYHAHIGALALDDHICGHSGAVQHKVDVSRRHSGDLAYLHHALDDADRLIRRGRRYFVYEDFLTRADGRLLQNNVRKRAPNINADTYHDI